MGFERGSQSAAAAPASERDAVPGLPHPPASMEALGERLGDVRRLVGRWTAHMALQPTEREDIVSDAMLRLLSRVAREGSFGRKLLAAAMVENVGWAVARHCEAGIRRSACELLTAPEELPEVAVEPPPCAAEQAGAIVALIEPLSAREREALIEHELLGLDFVQVAARLRTSVPAAKMACSRGRAKAREHAASPPQT